MHDHITIDLNADLGEWAHEHERNEDGALIALVSSANIACGFHAGGPHAMRATVERAIAHGVAIGAHPGYPDPSGFGRRAMDATPDQIHADVLYQIGALAAFCRAAGAPLAHVKPHGALYNQAAIDRQIAEAIARAVRAFDPALAVLAPPGSHLFRAALDAGLRAIAEVFADRAYNADGSLVSRRIPGSMIEDPEEAARRALGFAREGTVPAIDGSTLALQPGTICLHGDAPGAVARASAVRAALDAAGIRIAASQRR